MNPSPVKYSNAMNNLGEKDHLFFRAESHYCMTSTFVGISCVGRFVNCGYLRKNYNFHDFYKNKVYKKAFYNHI